MEPLNETEKPPTGETPPAAKGRPADTAAIRWMEWFPPSIRVALVLGILLLALTAVLIVQYTRYQVQTAVTRTRADMRSMATAIESYVVDNAWYPAHTAVRELMIGVDGVPPGVPLGTTFRRYLGRYEAFSLTTPVAYIAPYPTDPFAQPVVAPFRYNSYDSRGWIVASFGPDADLAEGGDIQFDDARIAALYPPGTVIPPATLLTGAGPRGAYTYDPTNGLLSEGDLWRIRQ